jgi:hypothetical protein
MDLPAAPAFETSYESTKAGEPLSNVLAVSTCTSYSIVFESASVPVKSKSGVLDTPVAVSAGELRATVGAELLTV